MAGNHEYSKQWKGQRDLRHNSNHAATRTSSAGHSLSLCDDSTAPNSARFVTQIGRCTGGSGFAGSPATPGVRSTMSHRLACAFLVVGSFGVSPAVAGPPADPFALFPPRARQPIRFELPDAAVSPPDPAPQSAAPPRVSPVEYSDAYRTRAKIHKYASVAMLPLVGTELALGQSIYNNPNDARRSAHIAVGTGILGLFAVNTVTGVWNLWESRNDPNGRRRRFAHALLMLGGDVGFLATAATGPHREHERFGGGLEGSPGTHRAIAISSMAMATAGYLIMLFGGR